MNQEKIGKFIKKLREDKGLTQEELGRILNITDKSISKWERGIHTPDLANFKMLADIFNVSINELVSGEFSPNLDKSNETYVKGIKYYIKKTRLKYLLALICLIAFIFIILGGIFIFNDYNKNEVYLIESADPNYYVKGYLVITPKIKLLAINEVRCENNSIGLEDEPIISNAKAYLNVNNKDTLLITWKNLLGSYNYADFLKTIYFTELNHNVESKKALTIDKIKNINLQIEYEIGNNKKKEYINLKLTKAYSNNKMFYK